MTIIEVLGVQTLTIPDYISMKLNFESQKMSMSKIQNNKTLSNIRLIGLSVKKKNKTS